MIPSSDYLARVTAAIRRAARVPLPPTLEEGHSFISDLGFDSMTMALLSLGLEEEFGFPIMLDGWLRSQPDPEALTIGALCDFLRSSLEGHEREAV
jgi:acyl carrier protein